ncbi:hypothetical protein ACMFFK_09670 [Serratia marcescens]|uniref:hypothetical protein n=1 Tax=Serratia marcescens TaxID=615 RepID=UPI000AAC6D7B|nr:hypothetical protein [Serratia marcescens]
MKLFNVQIESFFKYGVFLFAAIIAINSSAAHADNWYQGGTLHNANALTWQKASQKDKLATCADFIAGLYSKELLSPEISSKMKSVDDFKPYASELVKQLDAAFAPETDPVKNKKMFSNQSVKSTAMMIIIMMKWVES